MAETSAEGTGAKSKAQLKKERRERQEAERAAKVRGDPKPPKKVGSGAPTNDPSTSAMEQKNAVKQITEKVAALAVEKGTKSLHTAFTNARAVCDEMDDGELASVALGNAIASYSEENTEWPALQGANNVMLYETALLSELSSFVGAQKPSDTINMTDAVYANLCTASCTLVKQLLQHLHAEYSSKTMQEVTSAAARWMRDSVKERVQLAYDAIAMNSEHILNHCLDSGRQLMIYGWSSLVEHLLTGCERLRSSTSTENEANGRKFNSTFVSLANQPIYVCVLDAWPQQTGKRLVRRLSELNIRCTYALLNSIAAVIDRVGAVILSCECVFANGDALVPAGGAMIALTARHHSIPVIILAPTHKFADKIGLNTNISTQYEVLSSDLITGIVTEIRMLPASSAPAILRIKQMS